MNSYTENHGLPVIVQEYREIMLDDPFIATDMGVHERDHEVPDLSETHKQQVLQRAKRLLRQIDQLEPEQLTFDQGIDLALMRLALQKTVFLSQLSYNGLPDRAQKPELASVIINAFMYLMLKDPRAPDTRLRAIESRLHKIPAMIETYREVLQRPVERWRQIEQEELEAMPELFASILELAGQQAYPGMASLQQGIDKTQQAINDYLAFLHGLPAGANFSIGHDAAQELARLNGIDLDLDAIYRTARDFFRQHHARMAELVSRLKQKYALPQEYTLAQVLDHVKQEFRVAIDAVVGLYESEQARVMEFIKQSKLFSLPDSHKLLILKTPAYLVPSIPVGAMFPPAAFEAGPKTSVVYITVDEGRKNDQNALMITNTMIHEGIPGHHLQLAFAAGHESIVRRLANYNTHAEGWTTYLEGFMSEAGFIKPEILDEYLLIALADFARLGARVAIDLYFMTGMDSYLNVIDNFTPRGDTPFARAKSLLIKATGFTDARSEGELNWYSRERGYPMCYLMGNRMVHDLKADLLTSLGDAGQANRIFHEQYLQQGTMTIPLLRKVLRHKGFLRAGPPH
jgi:uncharacterized protein (DUF885 family)